MSGEQRLTEDNFLLYAAANYDNPQCYELEEFEEDIKRFKYIKRLLNRYKTNGELRERLILNHIIALNNVFGPANTTKMLFFKLRGYEDMIKPFLILIGILPQVVYGVSDKPIVTDEIAIDQNIVDMLRKL